MILENNNMRIECLPEHGGKLSSIYDKKNEFELLFQNPKGEYKKAKVGDNFAEYEACGFDDAFPNINKESYVLGDKIIKYPDHGEVWASDMKVQSYSNDSITLSFDSILLPYHYEKKYQLLDKGVHVSYNIKNIGKFEFPCFYTFHCLVNCSEGTQLLFPNKIDEVLMVVKPESFNSLYDVVSFPVAENGIDLTYPMQLEDKGQEKYFVLNNIEKGLIGYNFPNEKLKAVISYNKDDLPYLGFWNTQGGYRGDYNIALEMCNGFYDSISIAKKNNKCPVLKPNEVMKFSFNIEIEQY